MSKLTNATRKRLFAVLAKAKLKERRAEIISGYTNGNKASTSELTEAEAKGIAEMIEATYLATDTKEADRMRKKIIAIAHDMDWELDSGKADMERINNWCVKRGYLKKPLMQHTAVELPRLVSQFEQVYKWFLTE